MHLKNNTAHIFLVRRILQGGKEFERQRIPPNGLSRPFIPTDWETIEIIEVASKKAR